MAAIAQLGERQTEDLEVPSSILGHGILQSWCQLGEASGSQHAPQDAPPPLSPSPQTSKWGRRGMLRSDLLGALNQCKTCACRESNPGHKHGGLV
jgi:hypothetical protein